TMHGRIDVFTTSVLPAPMVTVPLLAWLHHRQVPHSGVRVDVRTPYTTSRLARRMWRLMVAQSRASDHVVVPSAHFADKLAEVGVGTPTAVVSNGVEPSVLAQVGEPAVRELTPGEPLRALWVGRLSPEKRPEVFVDAVRQAGGGVQGRMFGDGVARRAVARAAGGTPVRLGGSVPQSEVLAEMRRSHVLISSSVDFDNQPMVILEAIASGLPVLYADPDLAEVVPDGAGFMAPSPDAAGLASTLTRLLHEPELISSASMAMLAVRDSAAVQVGPIVEIYKNGLDAV
ncbi:MAG TPA: glycosyltransferase family 4 protein, partial [Candidatus Ruania gallistercoris]|nr:glycosyltransferase family 4 protein [Candidatus Ruania gallistercoris]